MVFLFTFCSRFFFFLYLRVNSNVKESFVYFDKTELLWFINRGISMCYSVPAWYIDESFTKTGCIYWLLYVKYFDKKQTYKYNKLWLNLQYELIIVSHVTWGTHLGDTKLVASTTDSPEDTSLWINSTFIAVDTRFFSFCNPSLGPTSTIFTKFGIPFKNYINQLKIGVRTVQITK